MTTLNLRLFAGYAPGLAAVALSVACSAGLGTLRAVAQQPHNVIVFVADGLRRNSVTEQTMPNFWKLRHQGVDFANSHSVFPTFTTANASVIATGHGLGDTGDYSNTIYPGVWLSRPDDDTASGYLVPFLENDPILADMNATFGGNYLGEQTLLSAARAHGYSVASVGKLGPTAIQQQDALHWDRAGFLSAGSAIIIDDATGTVSGLPLPVELRRQIVEAGLPDEAPLRTNGHAESSQYNNGYAGDAAKAGTLEANVVQQSWFADVSTRVLLPRFAGAGKPFVLLFWSRDPDGTQHDEGDSLQNLSPGINGPTSTRGLRNADRALGQLLDWLDAHPAVKATTDVFVTSDHGFATISRREVGQGSSMTGEVSAALTYAPVLKEAPEPPGTLPTGFLAVDLAVRGGMNLFDPAVRSSAGKSVFAQLTVGGDRSEHPATGSALLGDRVTHIDGSDARLIVASNGGSDMIYVPSGDPQIVAATLAQLIQFDYIGGLFVDDKYCPTPSACAGALPMSTIGLVGSSKVPRPAIVVTYKVFYQTPGDLQSAAQISDTTLQEGQGMHGGFGREQTFNNMAAMGPDFKPGFVDQAPMGNIDLAPTLAKILGLDLPAVGSLRGRVLSEAMPGGPAAKPEAGNTQVSPVSANGMSTVLEYQQMQGVIYLDDACFVAKDAAKSCR